MLDDLCGPILIVFAFSSSVIMSSALSQIDIEVVDSVPGLLSLLDNFSNISAKPPSLYLDLEGIHLGRHGSISIISLYIAPMKKIYLIDVHRLEKTTFSTANSSGSSLKTIFESPTIPKVIFDIRNDSDALFSHYQISVDCIEDLQLMELATRQGSKRLVAGLAKCIERDSDFSNAVRAEWKRMKDNGIRLFAPDKGGRYEVFNERPLKPEIVQYCANDLALLPALYKAYNAKLSSPGEKFWQVELRKATEDRIKLSQSSEYDGHTRGQALGPWSEEYIEQAQEQWNDDEDDWPGDTAQDCIGWEDDMVKNGEYF